MKLEESTDATGRLLLVAACCIGQCDAKTIVARSGDGKWDLSNSYKHTRTHRDVMPDMALPEGQPSNSKKKRPAERADSEGRTVALRDVGGHTVRKLESVELRNALAKLFVFAGWPLYYIRNYGFQRFMHALGYAASDLPSYSTVWRYAQLQLNAFTESNILKIKKSREPRQFDLHGSKFYMRSLFSLSLDHMTGAGGKEFLSVIYHWTTVESISVPGPSLVFTTGIKRHQCVLSLKHCDRGGEDVSFDHRWVQEDTAEVLLKYALVDEQAYCLTYNSDTAAKMYKAQREGPATHRVQLYGFPTDQKQRVIYDLRQAVYVGCLAHERNTEMKNAVRVAPFDAVEKAVRDASVWLRDSDKRASVVRKYAGCVPIVPPTHRFLYQVDMVCYAYLHNSRYEHVFVRAAAACVVLLMAVDSCYLSQLDSQVLLVCFFLITSNCPS